MNPNENEQQTSNFTSDAIFVTDNGGYSMDRPFTDRHIPCARDHHHHRHHRPHHYRGSTSSSKKNHFSDLRKVTKKKKKKKKTTTTTTTSDLSSDAITKAAFYGECASQGISFGDAHAAIEESQGCYRKWWLQQVQGPSSITSPHHYPRKVLIFCPQVIQLFHDNNPKKKRRIGSKCYDESHDETDISSSTSTTSTCHYHPENLIGDSTPQWKVAQMEEAKMDLLKALSDANGDTTDPKFQFALTHLESYQYYRRIPNNTCHDNQEYTTTSNNYSDHHNIDKLWFNMTKPTYTECLGKNSRSEYRYKLGRLSFDMFPSPHLVCSIQGMFNYIGKIRSPTNSNVDISIPTSLRQELRSSTAHLRSFKSVQYKKDNTLQIV